MDFDRGKAQGLLPKMFKVALEDEFTLYEDHRRNTVKVSYELVAVSLWTGSTLHEGHFTTAVRLGKKIWSHVDSGNGSRPQTVTRIETAEVLNSERTVTAFYRKTVDNTDEGFTPIVTATQLTPQRVVNLPKKKVKGAGWMRKFFDLFSLPSKKQVTSMEKDTCPRVGMSGTGKGRLTADISGPPTSLDRAADHSRSRPLGNVSSTGESDELGCGASDSSSAERASRNNTLFFSPSHFFFVSPFAHSQDRILANT